MFAVLWGASLQDRKALTPDQVSNLRGETPNLIWWHQNMQPPQKVKKIPCLIYCHKYIKEKAVSDFLTFLRLSIIHQLNNELF